MLRLWLIILFAPIFYRLIWQSYKILWGLAKIILDQLVRKICIWLNARNRSSKPATNRSANIQDLIQCKYCGIYVAESLSIYYKGNKYCSKAHAYAPG